VPAIQQLKHHTLYAIDGGHAAFLEQPDEFAEKFLLFIATLSAPSTDTVHYTVQSTAA
jgi:hypothetical protein